MRVSFISSHVGGDFSAGRLTVLVAREDGPDRSARTDEIMFEVPTDFHTHNDSVAAALMLLVGPVYPQVSFNFPISARCAGMLRQHYQLVDVGPVAADMEPRRPGRHLGLCLSGGLDSMALWLLLRAALGDEFKVITTDFGGGFAFEARGFQQFRRDVTCRTDFRWQGVSYGVRFVFSVPLLFADYADLGSITAAHHFGEVPLSIDSLRDGNRPSFLDEDASLQAGGLDGVHIARGLNAIALLKAGMLAEPVMHQACWHGSAPRGTLKHFDKGHALRILYQRQGQIPPGWLENIAPPRNTIPFGGSSGLHFMVLYVIRYLGIDTLRAEFSDIDCYDLSILNDLSLSFMERYNTTLSHYIPQELRSAVLSELHRAGVDPYSERDWEELECVRAFDLALMDRRGPLRSAAEISGNEVCEVLRGEQARARYI